MEQSQESANLELLNSIILGRDREIANTIKLVISLGFVSVNLYTLGLIVRFIVQDISADVFRECLALVSLFISGIWLLNNALLKLENRNKINKEVLLNAYSALLEYFLNPKYSAVVSFVSKQTEETEINLYSLDKLCEEKDARHFRIIGASGTGKTVFTDWSLRHFTDSQKLALVLKKKPSNFVNLPHICTYFNYDSYVEVLRAIQTEMYNRSKNQSELMLEFILDDWLAVLLKHKEAADILKELLVVARELNIRIWLISHTTRGKALGFEGAADLAETFLDVYLGKFARKRALAIRKLQRKGSQEWYYWNQVVKLSKQQGNRFAMIEDTPAVVPNLSDWIGTSREIIPDLVSTNQLTIEGVKVQGLSADRENTIDVTVKTLEPASTQLLRELEGDEVRQVRGINGQFMTPETMKSLVVNLRQEKFTKEKIISNIWNVSKGGNKRYKNLSKLLDAFLKD